MAAVVKSSHARFNISVLDEVGNLLDLSSSVVTVNIGFFGHEILLTVSSAAPTANGSSVDTNNPILLVLDQDDLNLKRGIYDMELVVLDDAGDDPVSTLVVTGMLVITDSML